MTRRFDIVMITDARLPGGTSASVAEEIRAQAAAGYRTGLLQVDSPLVRRRLPFAPRLRGCLDRGEAELLLGDEPIEADLLLMRHPTVAGSIDPSAMPAIRATNRLLIANQAPGVPADPTASGDHALRFEPHAVHEHLTRWLDGPVEWAPIGPLVRADLAKAAPDLEQADDDWVNVIDVAAWRRPRKRALYRIPVIGRHSRNDPMKWPATREEVLRVYPARDDVEVHVLGGDAQATRLLGGRLPANWLVHPFGTVPPERFLAGIDVYVYYHHPAWVEAFGRSILEALASGAPTVLPPHFEELFETAATYAHPDDVLGHVRDLHGDPGRYREAADRASGFADDRFGHGVHVRRLATLAEPSGTHGHVTAALPRAAVAEPERRRVLFVSSNGAGVGHLMRLMALARQAPADVEPLFLTFSQGAKVVDDAGYLVEYLASRSISGGRSRDWHPLLRERVNELIERYDLRAIVFDGTWPYQGLLDAALDQPDVGLVWSRRAMWKQGISNPVLDAETARFDLVIEPGEFAGDEDRGATRGLRAQTTRVGPVTFLGVDELLDRDEARAELGLDPERPTALVNLGAGNINDVSSLLGMVVDRLAQEPELQVCVTRSIIADRSAALPDNVRTISVYPLARYLPAFDIAFAAAGYNSFHELLLAAVPTAFVPNVDTATDDQGARSRFAERVGVGLDLPGPTPAAVDRAVRTLLDPDKRRRMRERAIARRLDNGAGPGMAAIVALLDRGVTGKVPPAALGASIAAPGPTAATRPASPAPRVAPGARERAASRPDLRSLLGPGLRTVLGPGLRALLGRIVRSLPAGARARLRRSRLVLALDVGRPGPTESASTSSLPVPPGNLLDEEAAIDAQRILIVLPAADTATVSALVDHTAQLQLAHRSFAPMFVTSDIDFRALRRYGYLFEYLPPRDRFERVGTSTTWAEARQQRLREIVRRFEVTSVITLPEPDEDGLEGLRQLLSALIDGLGDKV